MRARCWCLENKLKKKANITALRSEMCFQSLTAESKLFKLFIYFVMSQQLYRRILMILNHQTQLLNLPLCVWVNTITTTNHDSSQL